MVISLIGVSICLLGVSAALAQDPGCGVMESDPEGYVDPEAYSPLPEQCFGPGGPDSTQCTDDGCVIDILVMYTPAARIAAQAAGTPINDVIGEAVDAMNIAFENSLIQSFMRLVGTAELDYFESDYSTASEALTCFATSSCMPLAGVLRDRLKADMSSLFLTGIPGNLGGIAYVPGNSSLVLWNYAVGNGFWGFAHEAGHNLGAGHQVGVLPTTVPRYCHAYVHSQSPAFRTIEANGTPPKILHYSNPAVSYLDVPTGTPPIPPTQPSADNARCIRHFAPSRADRRLSDCNLNGDCDSHEIAVGTSQDCEHNGIPDECDNNGGTGACCLDGTCTSKTELCCLYQGGMYQGGDCGEDCNLNAVDDACESPGACCAGNGCNVIPEDCCIASGGTFKGEGARCGEDYDSNNIPDGCDSEPLGACCYGGMLCLVASESWCAAFGGTFGGAGTYCEDCNGNGWPAPCEGPTTQEYGACCTPEGECSIATECSCHGEFLGAGSACGAPTGACCVGTECMVESQACCTNAGGAFKGANTDCQDCNGNDVPDACESGAVCCLSDGSCVVWTESCCAEAAGTFLSEAAYCKVDQRACCRPPPYEDCVVTTAPCCNAVGGTWKELILTCGFEANCPSYNGPSQGP